MQLVLSKHDSFSLSNPANVEIVDLLFSPKVTDVTRNLNELEILSSLEFNVFPYKEDDNIDYLILLIAGMFDVW